MTNGRPVAALAGDLGRFGAAEVLQFLRLSGASGRLTFTRAGERVELHLTRGMLLRAHASRGSVRLGDVLRHRRLAPSQAIDAALARQRSRPGARLGDLMAEGGAPADAVRDALGEVFGRILLGVVLWPAGRFDFEPSSEAPDPGLAGGLDLDGMILESLRLADELGSAVGPAPPEPGRVGASAGRAGR